MVSTDTLQEGIVAPADVTASEPDELARISPALQNPPPNRSRPAKPPDRQNGLPHKQLVVHFLVNFRMD